jgi:hypothetical protein
MLCAIGGILSSAWADFMDFMDFMECLSSLAAIVP